jgi:phosphoesterase RecJ-like protein
MMSRPDLPASQEAVDLVNHPLSASRDSLSGRPVPEVLAEIAASIREAGRFLVTSHVGPDGDALGSAVALVLGLRALGKSARAVTAQDIPGRYEALLPPGVIENVEPADLVKANPQVDWFIVLDTSEPERIGGYRDLFFADGARRICIDHHRTHVRERYQHELVVVEAPATGSLVFALLDELNVELTPDIAQALWLAIATDTGWFRFSNTGPWALLDAARLARGDVDVEGIYDRVYHDLSPTRARLVGHVLQRARIELDGDLVWADLLLADRGRVGLAELDGVIDYLKMLQGARIIAFIVEVEPGSFKVSLRARGDAEVESVARSFGGGGHAKAAGCRFTGRLEDLIDQLRSRARSELARRGPGGERKAPDSP